MYSKFCISPFALLYIDMTIKMNTTPFNILINTLKTFINFNVNSDNFENIQLNLGQILYLKNVPDLTGKSLLLIFFPHLGQIIYFFI